MKKALVVCGLSLWALAAVAQMQQEGCAATVNSNGDSTCNTETCSGSYPLTTTEPCTDPEHDCFVWVRRSVECCGTVYYYKQQRDSHCGFASLKNEEERRKVLRLAGEYEILLADCTGAYLPTPVKRVLSLKAGVKAGKAKTSIVRVGNERKRQPV